MYDHLKRRFDLKSVGICAWLECEPADSDNPEYKMLKRHVETVHLGLKFVYQLCGMHKCMNNHLKATHKCDCPERDHEEGEPVVVPGELVLRLAPGEKPYDEEPEELCNVQDDHLYSLDLG